MFLPYQSRVVLQGGWGGVRFKGGLVGWGLRVVWGVSMDRFYDRLLRDWATS